MPYGSFKNNKHFMKGIELFRSMESSLLNFDSPEDVLSYIADQHGPNSKDVIYGFSAKSIREGKILQGKLLLHYLQETGTDIHGNTELKEMLNRVHELGEKRQEYTNRKHTATIKNPDSDEINKLMGGELKT